MSTSVLLETEKDRETYMDKMCACGHKLSSHGNWPPAVGALPITVWVSQCTRCGFWKNNTEFICANFTPV